MTLASATVRTLAQALGAVLVTAAVVGTACGGSSGQFGGLGGGNVGVGDPHLFDGGVDGGDGGRADGGPDGGDAGPGDGGCAGSINRPVSTSFDRCQQVPGLRQASLIDSACTAILYEDSSPICQGSISGATNAFSGTCFNTLPCSSASLPGVVHCQRPGTDAGCDIAVCSTNDTTACQ